MTHPPAGPITPPPPAGPKAPQSAERLYSVAELAALWGCSDDHIYDLIAAHKLAKTDIGTGRAKTRISASTIADYVARHTTEAKPFRLVRSSRAA